MGGRCAAGARRRLAGGGRGRLRVRGASSSSSSSVGTSPPAATPQRSAPLRVAVVCGGPSAERGVSLNSARAVLDHAPRGARVEVYYVDTACVVWALPAHLLYCNTPSDFDFRLRRGGGALRVGSADDLGARLAGAGHPVLAFGCVHGEFGEDGQLAAALERHGVPVVGTGAAESRHAFDKADGLASAGAAGFCTLPRVVLAAEDACDHARRLAEWLGSLGEDPSRAKLVVKPAVGGSSIGVGIARGVLEASERARDILERGGGGRAIVEIFAEGAREFTVIVLDGADGPVALVPTEVDLVGAAGRGAGGDGPAGVVDDDAAIFTYRRKYLPTRTVDYHTPPRFPAPVIEAVRRLAVRLFGELGLRDFARFDGFLLPPGSDMARAVGGSGRHGDLGALGTLAFIDVNIVSGMEQTSFLFQQAAASGISHAVTLHAILASACRRYTHLPQTEPPASATALAPGCRPVFVLFGGSTSERQVSLMSGTNAWLKMLGEQGICPKPFLLVPEPRGAGTAELGERAVCALSYEAVLRHTVEEVLDTVERKLPDLHAEVVAATRADVAASLGLVPTAAELPRRLSVDAFVREARESGASVFIAVHGGPGEDGKLQAKLEAAGVPFTGPGSRASRICMDKAATGATIAALEDRGVTATPKRVVPIIELVSRPAGELWAELRQELGSPPNLCIKPNTDGCSTGVVRLECSNDLRTYAAALASGAPRLDPGTLSARHAAVEMPLPAPTELLVEPFVETAAVTVNTSSKGGEQLAVEGASKWIECTVGVVGARDAMLALAPSVTLRESGSVLSLEEKFQGGTGVNLTPPPPEVLLPEALDAAKQRVELVAGKLGLAGFSRIDCFVHAETGELIVVEANTVPGLTPSTVLFHQTLAEDPPMTPRAFFSHVVRLAEQDDRSKDSCAA